MASTHKRVQAALRLLHFKGDYSTKSIQRNRPKPDGKFRRLKHLPMFTLCILRPLVIPIGVPHKLNYLNWEEGRMKSANRPHKTPNGK